MPRVYCDLQLYRNCKCQGLWHFQVLPQLWNPRSTAIRQFACAWCCSTWTQLVHTMLQHMRPRRPPPLMYCNIVMGQTGCERILWCSLFVLSLFSLCSLFALSLHCARESSVIWCSLFVLSLFSLLGSNGVRENSRVFSLCFLFELPLKRCELLRSEFWKCLVEVQKVCACELENCRTINHGRGGERSVWACCFLALFFTFPVYFIHRRIDKTEQKLSKSNTIESLIYCNLQ